MAEAIRIEVISDTVCPWCFIGKRQLERALSNMPEVEARIVWLPYFLDPSVPPGGIEWKQYLTQKYGTPEAGRALSGHLRSAAEEAGLCLDLRAQTWRPHTLDSHRLIHWARDDGSRDAQGALVEALFQAYFVEGRNIGDRDVLAAIAAAHGFDEDHVRGRLQTEDDSALVREQASAHHEMGITGVPCFRIEGFPVPGAQNAELFEHVIRRVLLKRAKKTEGECLT